MQYRPLGASGLQVSTLCLGTMTLGEADSGSMMHGLGCDVPTAHAILDRAVDAGINFLDTADVYGNDGLSERLLGDWYALGGARRERTVLATKFRFRVSPGPMGTGASRYRVMRCAEDSLRRLKTDRIDLFQVHMQDADTPEEETLRALDDLVQSGKVLYIGCSNYAAYRLMDSLWTSQTRGWSRYVSMQMQYSLVQREIEREHMPIATQRGVGILPWSPLAGGFLSGKYRRDGSAADGSRYGKRTDAFKRYDNERCWRILDAVLAVAVATGATPSQVSLAWLLQRPGVTSVIFGARSVSQLEENLPAGHLALDAAQIAALDEASRFDPGYPYEFIRNVQGRW